VTAEELYFGNVRQSGFTGLLSDKLYTIKITYSYDLNDGTGVKTLITTCDIYTVPEISLKSLTIDNTSAVFLGETIYITVKYDNPQTVTVEKVKINGKIYTVSNCSANGFYVSVVPDDSFAGGETAINLEGIYYDRNGKTCYCDSDGNNSDTVFVYGNFNVLSLEISGADGIAKDYAFNSDSLYYSINLQNATGYNVDGITIDGHTYSSEDMTVMDSGHILIPLDAGQSDYGNRTYSVTEVNYSYGLMSKSQKIAVAGGIYFAAGEKDIYTEDDLKDMDDRYIYSLKNDIKLSDGEWIPGNMYGVFLGNNYKISNLKIVTTKENADQYLGLFGEAEGIINDLTVSDYSIRVTLTGNSGGSPVYVYAGAVAGSAKNLSLNGVKTEDGIISVINNSKSAYAGGLIGYTSNVSNIKIKNSCSTVDVEAKGSDCAYSGGLIGCENNNLTIENSYATGDVRADADSYAYAGGFIGYSANSVAVTNSHATGDVYATSENSSAYAGGLVGFTFRAVISDSYAANEVRAKGKTNICSGGLVGQAFETLAIERSRASGIVYAEGDNYALAGGLVGVVYNYTVKITGCNYKGDVSADANFGAEAGGLIGDNNGNAAVIKNSWFTGNASASDNVNCARAGGLIGNSDDSAVIIENSYSSGNISVSCGNFSESAGGLIGYFRNGDLTIENSYTVSVIAAVYAYAKIGAVVGDVSASDSYIISFTNVHYYDNGSTKNPIGSRDSSVDGIIKHTSLDDLYTLAAVLNEGQDNIVWENSDGESLPSLIG
jgi:hypothetical protein